MTNDAILEIRKGSAKAVIEVLSDLDLVDVEALLEQENSDNSPRKTVVAAAQKLLKAANDKESDVVDPALDETEPSAKEKAGEQWQRPFYDGPLDINQADWRNRNLKRA